MVGNAGYVFFETGAGQIYLQSRTTKQRGLRTEEEEVRQVFSWSHEGWSGGPGGGDIWDSGDSVFLPGLCFRLLAGGQ